MLLTNVKGDLVPRRHKILVGAAILRLHVFAVGECEILLGQLVGQLFVPELFTCGPHLGHLLRRQTIEILLYLR